LTANNFDKITEAFEELLQPADAKRLSLNLKNVLCFQMDTDDIPIKGINAEIGIYGDYKGNEVKFGYDGRKYIKADERFLAAFRAALSEAVVRKSGTYDVQVEGEPSVNQITLPSYNGIVVPFTEYYRIMMVTVYDFDNSSEKGHLFVAEEKSYHSGDPFKLSWYEEGAKATKGEFVLIK